MSKSALKFIEKLLALDLESWTIKRIVEIEEVEESGRKSAYELDAKTKLRTGRRFTAQDNYYIWQIARFEDSYYGNILYPCDGKWLLISYEC